MSEPRRWRLAIVMSHAIQYQAPLFREIARSADIDLTVYLCSRWGSDAYHDREFGRDVRWDIPLLDGFRHRFLRNCSPLSSGTGSFLGLVNPGIVNEFVRHRYDAVIVPGYALASYWLAYAGAWLSGTPVFFRGEAVLRPLRPWPIRAAKAVLLSLLFRGTAAFLCIGSRSREFYEDFGVDPARLFSTPYTVDNDFFVPAIEAARGEREALRASLGLERGLPVFLFVGKLVPRKRPQDLLQAFEKVRDQAALVFVGDGPLRESLESTARRRGLTRVVFAGFRNQSELPRFYALADALVLPSSHEVSPLVLNEAMCGGLALVVSDAVPSAPDFVADGVNGHCYACGDVAALARLLVRLATSPDAMRALGAASRARIAEWSHATVMSGIGDALQRWGRRSRPRRLE